MASGSIDLDDIVKAVLTMLSVTVMLTGGLCAYGVIEDLMFKRQDIPIRHALGFNYPSTMMSDLFFIVVLYCWVMKMELSLLDMLLIEVLNLILFKLTDSRFGFLMIAVMTAGVYIFGLVRKKEIFAGWIWHSDDAYHGGNVRHIPDRSGTAAGSSSHQEDSVHDSRFPQLRSSGIWKKYPVGRIWWIR